VLRNLQIARGVDADLAAQASIESGLPTFTSLDEAARAIAAAQRFATRTSSRR
jgi:hypothetical protein